MAHVDPEVGSGAWHDTEVTEAQATHDDIERLSAQFDDAGAAGGVGEVVDHLGRSTVMPNFIGSEEVWEQESRGQCFAIVPNAEVLQLCSNRVLVKDIDSRSSKLFRRPKSTRG